jgi:hypothetical protein
MINDDPPPVRKKSEGINKKKMILMNIGLVDLQF